MTTLINKFKKSCGIELSKPSQDIVGCMMFIYLGWKNKYLENGAVKLCELEPDHQILEIGFGPGHGLYKAYTKVKGGKGKVYGLDISDFIIESGKLFFKYLINKGKVVLQLGSVMEMPFEDEKFDRIIHVNSFYYWPDLNASLLEIKRVMKPGAVMVSTMNRDYVLQGKEDGWARPDANYDPQTYVDALKKAGFNDVYMKDITKGKTMYQAVFCTK